MLTWVDVQLLVGAISLATNPNDVEVELGSKVVDRSTGTARDVDVTVLSRDADGARAAYVGIEVKDEKRPLDVHEVEGLATKLNDMPAITRRRIVSASGYTAPARRKAAFHGVELLTLRKWDPTERVFPFLSRGFETQFVYHLRGWVGLPDIAFVTDRSEEIELPESTLVAGGRGMLTYVRPFALAFAQRELDRMSDAGVLDALRPGRPERVQRCVTFGDSLVGWPTARPVRICGVLLDGEVECSEIVDIPEMKVLVDAETDAPHAACVIGVLLNHDLCGAVFTPDRPSPHIVKVPLSARNRRTLTRRRLSPLGLG
jgi:hypothetical protein